MSDWAVVWLAVMAGALVVMAAVQIALALAALKAARQLTDAVQAVRRDLGPLIERSQRIAEDAARVTALAAVQMERVDRLVQATSARVDDTLSAVRSAVAGPARHAAAIAAGIQAVLALVRAWQDRAARPATDDGDDPLFVG